jgi:nucleoside-diphosphate-sugar epimerase
MGCAGFIGSQSTDRLLALGHSATGYDNLSTSGRLFLQEAFSNSRFWFVEGDLLDLDTLSPVVAGSDFIARLEANADVRFGTDFYKQLRCKSELGIFNLGTDECCQVSDLIGWICEEVGLRPELRYLGGERGWFEDNSFIFLDCSAIRGLGWRPQLSSRDGVLRTVRHLPNNPLVFESV